VLSGLGETCDAVDVCGEPRALCAQRELGAAWSAISAAVSGAYPAFFCGEPDDEPTCVPSRPGQYTGAVTATDLDGDGLDGDADNCPRLFNPIRPIDGGAQPDVDGDGAGDPCDASPLPADMDDDGMDNGVDNCPWEPNPTQDDGDDDDKGDACDFCPEVANRTGVCPESPPADGSIVAIQQGEIAPGSRVVVRGVVVTGADGPHVYVQDPEAGPEWSGIHVFLSGSATVAPGDLVDVQGVVAEYFDDTEIEEATLSVHGPAPAPIEPVELTAAEAAGEAYEGVLVTVTGTVSAQSYSCAGDGDGCADAALWEVGGAAGVVVYDRLYQDADWAARIGQTPVTGVMGWRWERRRLMPRSAADFPAP
jgi:hypothetical protein